MSTISEKEDMVSWISRNNKISILIILSFLMSDDIYLSKIEIEGIVTATKNQIYRNNNYIRMNECRFK